MMQVKFPFDANTRGQKRQGRFETANCLFCWGRNEGEYSRRIFRNNMSRKIFGSEGDKNKRNMLKNKYFVPEFFLFIKYQYNAIVAKLCK